MSKRTVAWVIAASALILVGCISFVAEMSALSWDFLSLSTHEFEQSSYEVTDKFSGIQIDATTTDVRFAVSNDDKCHVTVYEMAETRTSVLVKDGDLVIEMDQNRPWYGIGIGIDTPRITVYLPSGQYTSLDASLTTGDVEIAEGFTFGDVKIDITTGDISITGIVADSIVLDSVTGDTIFVNVECKSFSSGGTTGDITLKNVIVSSMLSIDRGTGDVNLTSCDAQDITINTTTGDIYATLLSGKTFIAETVTGEKTVPGSTEGGTCRLSSTTGAINVKIVK